MIGALRRKLGHHVRPDVLGTVYNSCIRSVLDYGAPCWDPILKKDIDLLEKSQCFALRYFLNDWNISYNDALIKSGWKSLEWRRQQLKISQFNKYYNGAHDYSNMNFVNADVTRTSTRLSAGHRHRLRLDQHVTLSFTQSFEHSSSVL